MPKKAPISLTSKVFLRYDAIDLIKYMLIHF